MAAVPDLRPLRAPGRTCTRADPRPARAPAATRAGGRPRGRLGRPPGRASASGASGTSICAGSRTADDDEPVALVQDLAAAQLGREIRSGEVALEHLPARAVLEHPLRHLFVDVAVRPRGIHDDELARDAPCFSEEAFALGRPDMPL